MNDLQRMQFQHVVSWGDYLEHHKDYLMLARKLGAKPEIEPASDEVPYCTVIVKLDEGQYQAFVKEIQ